MRPAARNAACPDAEQPAAFDGPLPTLPVEVYRFALAAGGQGVCVHLHFGIERWQVVADGEWCW